MKSTPEREAHRLEFCLGCNKDSKIFDVGCGQGFLAGGLIRVFGDMDYIGMDVDKRCVSYCERAIGKEHPSYRFQHMDLYNARYNREGKIKIEEDFRFDVESGSIDIVYLFSVFSHMIESEMVIYLKEFLRILAPGGRVFFTAFAEKDVPNVSINPEGYMFDKPKGPLLVVRYNKEHLSSLLRELGYIILGFSEPGEGVITSGQCSVYLEKG